MVVLVTGCAGFIGSHLTERLLSMGKMVVGIDNFDPYYGFDLKRRNLETAQKNPAFKFYAVDLRNKRVLEEVVKNESIDMIVHLAAKAGVRPSITHPLEYEESNVLYTLNLLELAAKYGVKHFIFGSSSSVYGVTDKIPFTETDPADRPISPYGASKRSCELVCHTYSHIYNLPVTCLRFFTVYGPRQRPEMMIHNFTKLIDEGKEIPLYGDGTTKRDYTYISDIIDGVILAMEKKFPYEIINLGDSNTVELRKVVSLIEQNLGKKAKINWLPNQKGDVPLTYADISKAQRLLGYSPKVPIEEGVAKFVKWYIENKK